MMFFYTLPFGMQLLFVYLALINILTFFFFGFDKLQAQTQARRTPEKTLWFLCGIGGTIGALAGMKFFRHKTKKASFQLGFVLILLVQIGVVVWLLTNQSSSQLPLGV